MDLQELLDYSKKSPEERTLAFHGYFSDEARRDQFDGLSAVNGRVCRRSEGATGNRKIRAQRNRQTRAILRSAHSNTDNINRSDNCQCFPLDNSKGPRVASCSHLAIDVRGDYGAPSNQFRHPGATHLNNDSASIVASAAQPDGIAQNDRHDSHPPPEILGANTVELSTFASSALSAVLTISRRN